MVIENIDTSTLTTEERLMRSALRLFSEKGYEGTSIREIIEEAGVTRPVLYYYFQNKEDLFRKLVESIFKQLTDRMNYIKQNYSDTIGKLKAIIRATFEMAEQEPQAVRLILQVYFAPIKASPPIRGSEIGKQRFKIIESIMREGLEKAELSGGDARALTLAFLGIMDMHVMAKSDRPELRLTPELAEGIVDLFFYGACYKPNPPFSLTNPFNYV
ncbi:MAG: TetR/AcrR family transcriptional regulator [Candidatus Hydrogenedentes bacterium]|nr:TetR/AcrR family transcriptional regulator [Candidatus Hydrogenedentota bacterium]